MPTPHPYQSFVHLVEKPARYLGGEFGIRTKDWNSVKARVCLAFPDVYDIGMSHLGFKILYRIFNDDPDTLAERCYTPWFDMERELRARKLPLLSLENARPISEFDVIGFSLQFELTYTNILTMLDLGGIPLRGDARGENDPLIIAGGPTATHPEPVAPFIDAFVIGDGEERAKEIALKWVEWKSAGILRADRLAHLTELQGVYVPSMYHTQIEADTGFTVVGASKIASAKMPIARSLVDDLNKFPFPDDGPIGGPEAIFDRMSIEIARGCTEGCRFCQAGMIYRPVRERDPEQIVETVVSAVKKSGYDEASLTSLSTADYSCIAPLIKKVVDRLTPERVSLGVSSLRAYGLGEQVLDDMQEVRASGVTFAPEAGSQRMRDVVNKNVTEEQLMTTAERIFSREWTTMKLYFMIGLPTEEEEDVREIVRVGGRARQVGKRMKHAMGKGAPTVTVSVSTHVPKPHTPFQWCAMDRPEDVRKKQRWLRDEKVKAKVELRMHDSEGSWIEGILARGDRSLANVIERAYHAGARFDSWDEGLKIKLWEDALKEEGIAAERYLGTIPVTARLPWDHIDVGLEDGFLVREYRKALKSRLSPPCGKVAGAFIQATNLQDAAAETTRLVCYDCGVACDLTQMREERLVYLRKLGAELPREEKPKVVVPRDPTKGRKAPPVIQQGEPRRYRYAFTKLGPSAFLSHLDLIRALPRAFRRNDLPMFYSSGFHPKPDLTFSPALSLGVASLEEFVDIKLTADIDPSEALSALTTGSPDGIQFKAGTILGPNDATVSRIIDTAEYLLAFPRAAVSQVQLAARISEFLAKTEHKHLRKVEGIGKWINVREFVRTMEIDENAAADLARAGLIGDLIPVRFRVRANGSGSVKSSEIAEAIGSEWPSFAVRVTLGTWIDERIVSPMELGVHRIRTAIHLAEKHAKEKLAMEAKRAQVIEAESLG